MLKLYTGWPFEHDRLGAELQGEVERGGLTGVFNTQESRPGRVAVGK